MCAVAKLGQPTVEARRPTHFRARAREARAKTRRRRAAGGTRKQLRVGAKLRLAICILGGRRFTSGIPMRAAGRCLSCDVCIPACRDACPTRAKCSPFIRSHCVARGGTVNGPSARVTHRKQTVGHDQGRNFPVQLLPPVSPRISTAGRAFLPGVPETLRVWGWLPETVNRVETHLSHRKQTVGYASTRNVPAHPKRSIPRSAVQHFLVALAARRRNAPFAGEATDAPRHGAGMTTQRCACGGDYGYFCCAKMSLASISADMAVGQPE